MLLREEKKKALVKTSGRRLTNGKGLKNSEKNRASKIGSSSPGREGNAVGPSSGVASSTNSTLDLVEAGSRTKTSVNSFIVVLKKATAESIWGGGTSLPPDLRPIGTSDLRPILISDGLRTVTTGPEGANALTRRGSLLGEKLSPIAQSGPLGERRGMGTGRRRRRKEGLGCNKKTTVYEPARGVANQGEKGGTNIT